jgi:hypothetical protein
MSKIPKSKKPVHKKSDTSLSTSSNKFSVELKNRNPINFKQLEESYVSDLEEDENGYNPFSIEMVQYYSPIHSVLFDFSKMQHIEYSQTLSHRKYFIDMEHVYDTHTNTVVEQPMHIKFSPLIDNLYYLTGKYDIHSMEKYYPPSYPINESLDPKMNSHHNMSYVDCFFNYLANMLFEKHGFIHGIQFYGSCTGIQRVFKTNIADDIEYLNKSDFFMSNIGTLFSISKTNILNYSNTSCKNRPKLHIVNEEDGEKIEINVDDFPIENIDDILKDTNHSSTEEVTGGVNSEDSTDVINVFETKSNMQTDTSIDTEVDSHSESDSSGTSDTDSELNYSSEDEEPIDTDENENGEENEDGEEDAEEDENGEENGEENAEEDEEVSEEDENANEEEEINAYIKNYPVQIICLEKLKGTLDSLFNSDMDEDHCMSMSIQIIMILATYQKAFHFTHNDLHTNNIMYMTTEEPFIYYKYNKVIYRVPTYGRIYKIIDFGRSIYTFNGKIFCSDSFSTKGDAATQYNFGPFMKPNKPIIEPNYSFDLCRLGCSLYDFVIDSDEDKWEDMDRFQRLVYRWCMDDNDKNVLYKKNGEERYPDFKLYKMIARTVHKHKPSEQLNLNVFKSYISKISMGEVFTKTYFMDIDSIPCYCL